jgi:hypothetical protein
MWPKFEEFKIALEAWLNTNHRNFLKETDDKEWFNAFAGKHHSAVIIVN